MARGHTVHGTRGFKVPKPSRERSEDPEQHTTPDRIEHLSWEDFMARFRWEQGEHCSLIGRTGSGKTTLAVALIPELPYWVAFGTKARDDTMDRLVDELAFKRMKQWVVQDPDVAPRVILDPGLPKGKDSLPDQAEVFERAMLDIFRQGSWALFLDELNYITEDLKLQKDVNLLLRQGRSLGVSLLMGMQRPRHIPLLALSMPTHMFFWKSTDMQDVERIASLSGADSERVAHEVSVLPFHSVLYLNTATSETAITKVNRTAKG